MVSDGIGNGVADAECGGGATRRTGACVAFGFGATCGPGAGATDGGLGVGSTVGVAVAWTSGTSETSVSKR